MPIVTLVESLREEADKLGKRDESYEDNLHAHMLDRAADEIEHLQNTIREIAQIQLVFDPQPGYRRIREILNNEEWLADPESNLVAELHEIVWCDNSTPSWHWSSDNGLIDLSVELDEHSGVWRAEGAIFTHTPPTPDAKVEFHISSQPAWTVARLSERRGDPDEAKALVRKWLAEQKSKD